MNIMNIVQFCLKKFKSLKCCKYCVKSTQIISFLNWLLYHFLILFIQKFVFCDWTSQRISKVISSIESSNHYPMLSIFTARRSVDDSKAECGYSWNTICWKRSNIAVFEFWDSFNNLSQGSVIHDKQIFSALFRKYH